MCVPVLFWLNKTGDKRIRYFFLPIGNYSSKYSGTSGTGSRRKIIKEYTEKER